MLSFENDQPFLLLSRPFCRYDACLFEATCIQSNLDGSSTWWTGAAPVGSGEAYKRESGAAAQPNHYNTNIHGFAAIPLRPQDLLYKLKTKAMQASKKCGSHLVLCTGDLSAIAAG